MTTEEERRKAAFARMRSGKGAKPRTKVPLGRAKKPLGPLRRLQPVLDAELRLVMHQAGEKHDRARSIALRHLAASTLDEIRQEGARLAHRLADAFVDQLDLGADEAGVIAAEVVLVTNIADRRAALRAAHRPRSWDSPGYLYGYNDAFDMISHAVGQGKSLDLGVQNHRVYRKVGDDFSMEHGDPAAFHRGAELAYKDILAAYADAASKAPSKQSFRVTKDRADDGEAR